jgi:hypothetical protein
VADCVMGQVFIPTLASAAGSLDFAREASPVIMTGAHGALGSSCGFSDSAAGCQLGCGRQLAKASKAHARSNTTFAACLRCLLCLITHMLPENRGSRERSMS